MRTALLLSLALLTACASSPPSNPNNVCSIFDEKDGWYDDAADAREEWGSPIWVMMAIMHQESRFDATARPPRKKILGFIPGPRPSSAYGYPQAKDTTWDWYKKDAGRWGADRDDFADAIDFIGWYNHQSRKRSGISLWNPNALYLAYHEGHGGYNRATYQGKAWLLGVARKVESQAVRYRDQLARCEEELKDRGGFFSWF